MTVAFLIRFFAGMNAQPVGLIITLLSVAFVRAATPEENTRLMTELFKGPAEQMIQANKDKVVIALDIQREERRARLLRELFDEEHKFQLDLERRANERLRAGGTLQLGVSVASSLDRVIPVVDQEIFGLTKLSAEERAKLAAYLVNRLAASYSAGLTSK